MLPSLLCDFNIYAVIAGVGVSASFKTSLGKLKDTNSQHEDAIKSLKQEHGDAIKSLEESLSKGAIKRERSLKANFEEKLKDANAQHEDAIKSLKNQQWVYHKERKCLLCRIMILEKNIDHATKFCKESGTIMTSLYDEIKIIRRKTTDGEVIDIVDRLLTNQIVEKNSPLRNGSEPPKHLFELVTHSKFVPLLDKARSPACQCV
jgi:hypothetical protein